MLAKGRATVSMIRNSNKELRSFEDYHSNLMAALKQSDADVYGFLGREYRRVQNTIQLIAAENQCSRAVLAALGSIVQNKTTEGFPGARFHGGCEIVDDIERLAIERARQAFGAKYANVQPHSGTQANQIVITAILEKDDKILSLGMERGDMCHTGQTWRLRASSSRSSITAWTREVICWITTGYESRRWLSDPSLLYAGQRPTRGR